MRPRHVLILVHTLFACSLGLAADQPSMDSLEKQFRELPMESRRLTGPLFWLHGDERETKERLEMYVEKVAEGGNGCFTTESRPHKDWLGEGWFRDLAICLEAAKKHNLKMWIFDEKWWPSGEVGGKVPVEFASKRLSAAAVDVKGSQNYTADGYEAKNLVGVIAGKVSGDAIDGSTLVDLAGSIRDGKLTWQAPAGEWKVMKFTWAPERVGNRYLVDGASKDAIDWYIRTVFDPHYDRFKDDFGKNIMGFFYDEPETHGDWGTEVIPMLKERGADWKKALVAYKFKLAGEEQIAAKYAYLSAFAEAWGRTMYGGMTKWCEQHGVQSIGHWLEHTNEYVNPNLCAGDMFQVQKYSSMGGIDAVFDQFKWGKRAIRDVPCWQTPKLGSSITHAYGKPDDVTMVEIFGARGQDLTYPEMKWWTDHMHVSGVNFMIPHSFNPKSPRDTDCPPYFYNGGFEPRWPLYRVYADYTSRLSVMLQGGRHVCPVALLWAGQTVHLGKNILPDIMSESLQDALYDCDWLPTDVFEGNVQVNGKSLELRDESYRVLVMPACEVISYETLVKAKAFFDAGGTVVAYGLLPSQSATLGKTSADIAKLCDAIWSKPEYNTTACKTNDNGGRSYFLPGTPKPEDLQAALAGDAKIHPTLEVLEGATDHWLHVLHRVKAGSDLFFITNQNLEGGARTFKFRITAQGYPECWDAMRNEIAAVPFTRNGDQVEMTLTMEPNDSVLLVFQPQQRKLPARIEKGTQQPITSIPMIRLGVPPAPEPMLDKDSETVQRLEKCSWVWYPQDGGGVVATAGKVYFRKQFSVPADRQITRAVFRGTADNSFVLYVNGKSAGHGDDSGEGWRNPVQMDIKDHLQKGTNQLAIEATNATDKPSPAGLIGELRISFDVGKPLTLPIDATWKASKEVAADWKATEFDDSSWATAKQVAKFGAAPWGRLSSMITLSPAKRNYFFGGFELSSSVDVANSRVYLEADEIQPEEAARVKINDKDAGGFIGKPLRLDVTRYLKPGSNTVQIDPFAPKNVRVAVYSK